MPEPVNKDGGTGEEVTPKADAFGVTLDQGGNDVKPEETITKEDDKGEDGKKKTETDDIANHPSVVALNEKIKEYGENLSGQRDAHDKEVAGLKKQLADALEGKGGEDKGVENVMFKDIKFSKDLSQDERDDMTDTEIKLFDQNSQMQTAMNKMFEGISNTTKAVEEVKVEDLNSSARTEAVALAEEAIKENKDLAKDSKELADKIIVEFNEYNNDGISADKLKERMKKALNNVSGYTPPKEQENKGGKGNNAVKGGVGGGADEFGIDKIVADVNKKNDGTYTL